MTALAKAIADLNRREISWMDIPEDVRKKLTAMEDAIHEADAEGQPVMDWYRLILKSVKGNP